MLLPDWLTLVCGTLQVLEHTLQRLIGCPKTPSTRVPGVDKQALHHALVPAMGTFLGDKACKFSCFLVQFLTSIGSIASWDAAVADKCGTGMCVRFPRTLRLLQWQEYSANRTWLAMLQNTPG
jgi:hypothetical protein